MNVNGAKLRMFSTNFDSPHGLMNKFNYSTAYDVCLLTASCMKYRLFRDIVKTKVYTCSPLHSKRTYTWENTNKLLETTETCIGCKTGITDTAGPCFSGCFDNSHDQFCIVVLNSKTMEQRWIEVPQMAEWAFKRKALARQQAKRHQQRGPSSSNFVSHRNSLSNYSFRMIK